MEYTSWPVGVNKRIIDSTSITVGEGAVITDSIEGSPKVRRRMLCANPPDKFNVKMHFNCYDRDENGLTEKDRFFEWLKGIHKFGSVPFEFPSILFNSNEKESYDTEEVLRGNIPFLEHYVITSSVQGSKHGYDIEVTMTWETYATGIYEIPYSNPHIDSMDFHDGYTIVSIDNTPKTMPVTNDFRVEISGIASEDLRFSVYGNDNDSTFFYIVYPKITDDDEHDITIEVVGSKVSSTQDSYTGKIRKGE